MTWYKNQGGSHDDHRLNPKTVPNGGICQTDLDLPALFPGKFQIVDPPANVAAAKVEEGNVQGGQQLVTNPENAKPSGAPETIDVTADYAGAGEAGFKVLQVQADGKIRFNIFDGEAKVPTNDKPLTAGQVSKALSKLGVKGDEE